MQGESNLAKRIIKVVIVILFVLIICELFYVFIFDTSKETSYQLFVDKTNLVTELKRLNAPAKELSHEIMVNNKEFKAILVIDSGLESNDSRALTIKEIADRYSHGGYYEFTDQSMEAAICDIQYTHIKDAIGYGWLSYRGNLYAERYGREKAKGKPNYRYQVEIFIRKEDSNYHILAFCNTDSINNILTEAVNQINEIEE